MTAGTLVVPPLREELSLHAGPTEADGAPSWTLRDPVRNRFFRIGWPAFEILSRWDLGQPELIADAVRVETTLDLDGDGVLELLRFLVRNHLTRPTSPADTARLAAMARAEQPSWAQWLLHHYLFFRVPLLRPDGFLVATGRFVAWLGGRGFRHVTFAALLLGLVLLARHWDQFTTTLIDMLTPAGAASYGLALVVTKIVHEFAHAYTARRLGCRVPTMGVAFLVLWPVLYTDVNEAWLLPRRRDRLAVGAAGIVAELMLASWATLGWGLLGDGPLRQACFVLASTTWVSTLLINLSPFMRFDGYFLAMDALNMPNLHPRAFAIARWQLREILFGFGETPPENFAPATRHGLTLFAWGVWTYRLTLFLGIAALVYHFFIKLVGIGLFAVEIGWFVVLPVWHEVREWSKRGRALIGRRGLATLAASALLVLLAVVPWRSTIAVPAIFEAAEHRPLYPPAASRVEAIVAHESSRVAAGDILFRLAAPDVAQRLAQATRRIAMLEQELSAAGFAAPLQSRMLSLREELQGAVAARDAAQREAERLTVTAPIAGTIVDLLPDLEPGQWLSPTERLASVVSDDAAVLTAYVPEESIDRVRVGATARFFPTSAGRAPIAATVVSVERSPLHRLDAPALASTAGGAIVVRPGDRTFTPEQALYRVRLATPLPPAGQELVGTVHLDSSATSLVGRAWRTIAAALIRESGM